MLRSTALCLVLALLAPASPHGALPAAAAAHEVQFAVIVHPSTPVEDVTLAQLRRLFLGQQQFWSGGGRVVLFVHPAGTAEGDAVLRHLYQMTAAEYKRYWIAKTFRDDIASGPKIVSSNAMARRLTASVPGAIAVIAAADADSTVKVLSIDRQLPGVGDYPLAGRSP